MGGMGSGNWYRFDKKVTTGECHSIDVRYLQREDLLKISRLRRTTENTSLLTTNQ
jgi:hypothetical protein